MILDFLRAMVGWFAMVCAMGFFIWGELKNNELELEEEDEPPSSRLAVAMAGCVR